MHNLPRIKGLNQGAVAQPGEGQWADSGAMLVCAVRVRGALWGGGTQPACGGGSLTGANGSLLPHPALSSLIRVTEVFKRLSG